MLNSGAKRRRTIQCLDSAPPRQQPPTGANYGSPVSSDDEEDVKERAQAMRYAISNPNFGGLYDPSDDGGVAVVKDDDEGYEMFEDEEQQDGMGMDSLDRELHAQEMESSEQYDASRLCERELEGLEAKAAKHIIDESVKIGERKVWETVGTIRLEMKSRGGEMANSELMAMVTSAVKKNEWQECEERKKLISAVKTVFTKKDDVWKMRERVGS
jgi:hypothetical protein